MAEARTEFGTEYRQGFRDGVGMIVRGLLLVDADELDAGALIGALSRYEEQLEAWRDGEDTGEPDPPPTWRPAAKEISVEEG